MLKDRVRVLDACDNVIDEFPAHGIDHMCITKWFDVGAAKAHEEPEIDVCIKNCDHVPKSGRILKIVYEDSISGRTGIYLYNADRVTIM